MIVDELIAHAVGFPCSAFFARVTFPSCPKVHRREQEQRRIFLAGLVTVETVRSVPETTPRVVKEKVPVEQRHRSATERGGGGDHGGDFRK